MEAKEFADLGLTKWLCKNLASINIERASPIQRELIKAIVTREGCRQRRNVFAASPTGSGKTLAYVLPILHFLSQDLRPYFALVLAPTRELAYQINEIVKVLTGASPKTSSTTMIKTLLMIGGGKNGLTQGESEMQGFWQGKPNIVIATPGRLAEQLIRRNYLEHCGHKSALRFDFLVLDEADQLISTSFSGQLKQILDAIDECRSASSPQRQTLVLSATLTSALEQLQTMFSSTDTDDNSSVKEKHLPAVTINLLPSMDELKTNLATNPNLDQRYLLCPESVKPAYLIQVLSDISFKQVIVFCATKRQAKLIHRLMVNLGFDEDDTRCHTVLLNSDLAQIERFRALEAFKSLKSRILVTTDIANRGLDLPQVDLIINYNCPTTAVNYVHRVGRTCRKIDFTRIDALEQAREVSLKFKLPSMSESECKEPSGQHAPPEESQNKRRKVSNDKEKDFDVRNKQRMSKAASKYYGKSIVLITQYDIELLKNIEHFINKKLTEEDAIDHDNIADILKPVAIAIKDAELSIEEEGLAKKDRR
ncbi:putative ATP-dependent RNA helicase DDX49, partial [Fragariocoptes setiger]